MTNDSTDAHVSNNDARANGDDAFALFSAIDGGGSVGNHDNVFENLSATLTWRAAGLAVYGGYNNIFRNLYIADMLTYAGITISSLDFGYPFVGLRHRADAVPEHLARPRRRPLLGQPDLPGDLDVLGLEGVPRHPGDRRGHHRPDVLAASCSRPSTDGGTPQNPVTDTIFTNVTISGAQKSGDAFDAKSGFGIWANELPEPGQGPAVGSVTFNHLTFSNNFQNIKNTTTTFTIVQNP